MLAQQMQRLDPVSRRQYGVTGMLERVDGRAAQLRLIFHDQHRLMPATRRHGHLFVRSGGTPPRHLFCHREVDAQPRARAWRAVDLEDRKSTRLNSSHVRISYAVFCLKKKTTNKT